MLRYKYYLILILCGLQLSCSSSDDNTYEQNKFVHELLLDRYFWYQEVVPVIDYNDFDSPEQTLDFLKYHELDRFSYIADADEFYSLFNQGQTIKYGFSFFIEADGSVPIRYVFDGSAADGAALERGDQILSINNQTVEQIISSFGWEGIFGPDEDGYPVDMLVQKKDGSIVDIYMEKSVVNINTVLHQSIIPIGVDTVGYLVFHSFLSTSKQELADVFSEFAGAGVNKLVLDLRYNGGGLVDIAQTLASYMRITDINNPGRFALLKQNDKNQDLNNEYSFLNITDELNLEQVVVITTGATASASEIVINGLKPFVDVKTIGSETYGKPVGMNVFEFDDKVILPITFRIYNQDGDSYPFDGIPVDCTAQDDLNFTFGDIDGPMLSEALFVIQNNTCSPSGLAQKTVSGNEPQPSYSLQAIIGAY